MQPPFHWSADDRPCRPQPVRQMLGADSGQPEVSMPRQMSRTCHLRAYRCLANNRRSDARRRPRRANDSPGFGCDPEGDLRGDRGRRACTSRGSTRAGEDDVRDRARYAFNARTIIAAAGPVIVRMAGTFSAGYSMRGDPQMIVGLRAGAETCRARMVAFSAASGFGRRFLLPPTVGDGEC